MNNIKELIVELAMADTDKNGHVLISKDMKEELTDALVQLCKTRLEAAERSEQHREVSLDACIKVKLTDRGKRIYGQSQEALGRVLGCFLDSEHGLDINGYTKFTLRHFIAVYGNYIEMADGPVVSEIII